MNSVSAIFETGIIPVIRGGTVENIIPIARALKDGGIKVLEITVETPGALAAIEKVAAEVSDIIVGAGTVLDKETARSVILSGAKFIFSPTINIETIKMTKRYGIVSIPGAFTPTEILTGYEHGADYIKVFPANVFGPKYIKDIHGPLPYVPLIATGGISVHNAGDFIKAGAAGVGIGSSLVNTKKELTDMYLNEISESAREYLQIIHSARN